MPKGITSLTNAEAQYLFAKFAAPLFRAAKSPSQRTGAQRLARWLWLALLTGADIEALVFHELEKVARLRAEDIQIVKDRYYKEMKPSITQAELQALKARYKVKRK